MLRSWLTAAGVLMAILPASALAAQPPPTPDQIAARVGQVGPKAAIDELMTAGRWDAVATRIGSGGAAWIALAPMLAPGADAGSAEDLGLSLATAPPNNPRGVLAVLDLKDGPVIGPGRVCSAPFIEDPAPHHAAYVKAALSAVGAVDDARLAQAKAACLTALKAAN